VGQMLHVGHLEVEFPDGIMVCHHRSKWGLVGESKPCNRESDSMDDERDREGPRPRSGLVMFAKDSGCAGRPHQGKRSPSKDIQ
jgi:hypothetical protein